MTNTIHLLLPEPGWHEALRALTRQYGTLRNVATGEDPASINARAPGWRT